MLALQWLEPPRAAPDPDQIRLRLLGERQEVFGVAPPELVSSGDSSSRSGAYSRIVSSIQKRSSARTRTRLLSTSD